MNTFINIAKKKALNNRKIESNIKAMQYYSSITNDNIQFNIIEKERIEKEINNITEQLKKYEYINSDYKKLISKYMLRQIVPLTISVSLLTIMVILIPEIYIKFVLFLIGLALSVEVIKEDKAVFKSIKITKDYVKNFDIELKYKELSKLKVELEKRNNEIDILSQKINNKNSIIDTYKNKININNKFINYYLSTNSNNYNISKLNTKVKRRILNDK